MICLLLLGLSILLSLAFAALSAMLLDYNLIDPYIYSVTYFDPSDSFSYISFAILYAPLPLAAVCLWRRSSNR